MMSIIDEKFWKKTGNGKAYTINSILLQGFIEKKGFRRYKEWYIKLENSIAIKYTENDLFEICLNFVKSKENNVLSDCFVRQGNRIITLKPGILTTLKECEYDLLRDTPSATYIPFLNGIIKTTKDEIVLIKYKDLKNKFVLNEAIIKRSFCDNSEKSVMEKFIGLVSDTDETKKSIMTIIGFLLSNFKDPTNAKAIIISDVLSQVTSTAEGGSGKGLIVQAIKQMHINIVTENGKNLNLESPFAYQSVTDTTRIFFLDDVKKGFDFEHLFSSITNDFKIERKGKQAFTIPYTESPKILIATNYPIKRGGSSYNRRQCCVVLNNYFNSKHTPFDEFGHTFFENWDSQEWCRFDNFMIQCSKLFLQNGLIEFEDYRLKEQKIKNHLDENVFDNLEKCELNKKYKLKDLGLKHIADVEPYADYKKYDIIKGTTNGVATIEFRKK